MGHITSSERKIRLKFRNYLTNVTEAARGDPVLQNSPVVLFFLKGTRSRDLEIYTMKRRQFCTAAVAAGFAAGYPFASVFAGADRRGKRSRVQVVHMGVSVIGRN